MYEIFEHLLQKHGVTSYKVAKSTGISQTTLSNWKSGRSIPKNDAMQKIADFFGVTIDYLTTGNEPDFKKEPVVEPIENRDLALKIDEIIGDMNDPETSPLYFNGEKLDDKSIAILAEALSSAMKQVEIMRKKK
jgi:transcriptional regulator with XRE-family HTH domain